MRKNETFLWYDLETFGLNSRYDRIAQFACVRTDLNLNIIEEPTLLYCKLSSDYLPDPLAVLVTGITPQLVNEKGVNESQFIGKINDILSVPGTCSVGYNTLRFDDEFIRFSLFRNFLDPYKREYDKGNSRWDILDLVRASHDLRPEGINWLKNPETNRPSFKLTDITKANSIANENAHDALNDVYATLEVARLIKRVQPKLFDYYLRLRSKQVAKSMLQVPMGEPVLLTAAPFTTSDGCSAVVLPITASAQNPNTIIVFDLMADVDPLINASNTFNQLLNIRNNESSLLEVASSIKKALETKEEIEKTLNSAYEVTQKVAKLLAQLPQLISAHDQLLSIRGVHQVAINRAPFISPLSVVTDELSLQLGIDLKRCFENKERLEASPLLPVNIRRAFDEQKFPDADDVEQSLYSGSFFSDADAALFKKIRETSVAQLWQQRFEFEDQRAHELLWRYLCRNWEENLDEKQKSRYHSFCANRLLQPPGKSLVNLYFYARKIEEKLKSKETSAFDKETLIKLRQYGQSLCEKIGLTYPLPRRENRA
ncbi:MAG: exodeoxyribonuclease I [Sphaerochaetaceae bacterium]|jgi:exodeoxyribonuclease-1